MNSLSPADKARLDQAVEILKILAPGHGIICIFACNLGEEVEIQTGSSVTIETQLAIFHSIINSLSPTGVPQ